MNRRGQRVEGVSGARPRDAVVSGSVPWSNPGQPLAYAILALLVATNLIGLGYYVQPMAERVRNPMHTWLKSSGYIGQSAGILAALLFIFMWLYPLRKRVRKLAFTGTLARWLDVHISAGLVLPLLGATHASWRFNGVIGLGYLAMLVVSASGIVGRYLYRHIPRGASGVEFDRKQIEAERSRLLGVISETTGMGSAQIESVFAQALATRSTNGFVSTLRILLVSDLARWRAVRELRRRLRSGPASDRLDRATIREAAALVGREVALTQQARLLDATRAVFRFWHVAHMPFALTAFLAVMIHVGVAMAVGVAWFW